MRRRLEEKLRQAGCFPRLFVTNVLLSSYRKDQLWTHLPNKRCIHPDEVLFTARTKISKLNDLVHHTFDRHLEMVRRDKNFRPRIFVTAVFALEDVRAVTDEDLKRYEVEVLEAKIKALEERCLAQGTTESEHRNPVAAMDPFVDFEDPFLERGRGSLYADGRIPFENVVVSPMSLPSTPDLIKLYRSRLQKLTFRKDPVKPPSRLLGNNNALYNRVIKNLPTGGGIKLLGLCVWEKIMKRGEQMSVSVVRKVFVNRNFADEVGVALLQSLLLSSNISHWEKHPLKGYYFAVDFGRKYGVFRRKDPALRGLGNLVYRLFVSMRQEFDMADPLIFKEYARRLAEVMDDVLMFNPSAIEFSRPPENEISLESVLEVSSLYGSFYGVLGNRDMSVRKAVSNMLYNLFRSLNSAHLFYLEPLRTVSPFVNLIMDDYRSFESLYEDEIVAKKEGLVGRFFCLSEHDLTFYAREASPVKMALGSILSELFIRKQVLSHDIPGVSFVGKREDFVPPRFKVAASRYGCFFPSELLNCGSFPYLQLLVPPSLLVDFSNLYPPPTTKETEKMIRDLVKRIKRLGAFEELINPPEEEKQREIEDHAHMEVNS